MAAEPPLGKLHRRGLPAQVQADQLAGSNAVWLVWSNTYPPTQGSCSDLRDELTLLRRAEETLIPDEIGRYPDHAGLLRYG